jgi:hypothetical protein
MNVDVDMDMDTYRGKFDISTDQINSRQTMKEADWI